MSRTRSQQATYTPGQYYRVPMASDDLANLATGVVHLVESRIPTVEQHRCLIMPRSPIYTGEPSFKSIRFTAVGTPGPTIGEIVRGRMQLERPHDHVLAERASWSRTRCLVDWPGVEHVSVNIYMTDSQGGPLTREHLAKEVAAIIYRSFKANPHVKVSWADVRLLALAYYRNVWIPILALDC
ncbi:hypothetical protein D9615_002071 [Tricholomella constricta]|uniref:Uncharacterized protein n=1 Tax=Tricholomella constricta TaxID=117010 RepID=A0A8H5MAE6_9AGAR|nr:hypothetical protein D9615_002071 [Tricholomella constricta]